MKLSEVHKLLLICLACAFLPLAVAAASGLLAVPSSAGTVAAAGLSSTAGSPLAPSTPLLRLLLPLGAAAVSAAAGAGLLARRRAAVTSALGRDADRLALLHEASQALSRATSEEQVHIALQAAVSRLAPSDALEVAWLSDDGQSIDAVVFLEHAQRRETLRPDEGLAGYVVSQERALLLRTPEGWPPGAPRPAHGPPAQSAVALPLRVGERVYGMLAASAGRPHAFAAETVPLLMTLANQAAAAILSARQQQLVRRQQRTLTLLHEVAQATAAAATVDDVVSKAVEVLAQRLGYEIIGVALIDAGGETWSIHASYRGAEAAGAVGLPLSQGLIGAALRSGEVQRIDDVSAQPAYVPVVTDIQSELVVPLKVADRVIGAINTESPRLAAYGDTDQQVLSVVAGLLAPIIENVQLRARAEQQAHDLNQLVQVHTLSSSLNVNDVLTGVVKQLALALDVTSAYVVELRDGYAITVAEYYSPDASYQERISDLYVHYREELFASSLQALRDGQPVHMRLDDDNVSAAERQHLRLFGGRTALVVPLLRQGNPLGYVKLWESRRDRRFNEGEIQLAQSLASHAANALENARLYEAARRRAEQMRLVNEIGRDLGSILDVEALVEHVCRRVESAFGYYHAKLGLVDGNEVVFPERLDERRGRLLPEARLKLDDRGLITRALRQSQPALAADVTVDPDYVPNPQLPGTRSEVAVPVIAHSRILGVLDVQSNRVGDFRPDDVATLEAIAGLAAVAIENARLFGEARQRSAEVSALMTTAMALGSSPLNLDERLRLIAREAMQLVEADSATIYQLAPDGRQLRPLVVIDEHYAEQVMADVIAVGEGIIGLVVQSGVGEMVNRVDLDPRAVTIPGTPNDPESLLAIPLAVGDRVIGLMAVYRESLREFDQHHFDLISSFAAQAAVAIQNAELYETVRQRANSLQAAYEELAEMDRLKDELVQNISHELRTPLTFLKSYVDLLLSQELGPLLDEQAHSLRIVQSKTESLARLVNDIITLQAVTPATLKQVPLDLIHLARGAADGVAAVAREAGLDMEVDLPDQAVPVHGDPLRLTQVFDNLLGNAIKFTARGGRISLRAQIEAGWVRAEVCDTGVGIAPEFAERIFDRFYQVDGTLTRRRGGIGLGLAICKLIVEVHGGHIGVESEPGRGSCFYFRLPLHVGGSAPANVASTP